ncbi:peptidoglycan DD-metalloendopeptidase family protein [Pleionea litopenaei]|uniref:Peptidoglycan DD-metalloendopeptidase family protein n=1 Tax=Pleionea litopenaei TaxID=3070815 RepID=A0AA51RVT9_9GAMM|nr:peptidoglycan DD-metalloendopeptidase family protein [Pleionea sp. HL-JVS1]WMS88532.1 peptidoglycan DD-metalloendopeptidase family protein [Pleionea sp. HL-JVS1]
MNRRSYAVRLFRPLTYALVTAGLFACGHHVPAPVVNLSYDYNPPSNQQVADENLPEFHLVEEGDTLFSIAWRYGVDYRELADLNRIDNDYRIYPGQKLNFALQQSVVEQASFDESKLKRAVFQALNLPIQESKIADSNNSKSSKVRAHSQQKSNKPVESVAQVKKSSKSTRQAPKSSGNAHYSGVKIARWHWPVKGSIIDGFSDGLYGNKGVDISGRPGEAVRAAAQGRVVYRGNALKGYGNLIIVKHNDDFLSAYAHNSKIHVKENEIVKAGQVIADIGNSGADQSKLHFEIRYRGKPVDPIKYLPKL